VSFISATPGERGGRKRTLTELTWVGYISTWAKIKYERVEQNK